jgi:hypothetical protein
MLRLEKRDLDGAFDNNDYPEDFFIDFIFK